LSRTRPDERIETTELYALDLLKIKNLANFGLTEDILNTLLQGIKGKVD
jgi:hypothetical protein